MHFNSLRPPWLYAESPVTIDELYKDGHCCGTKSPSIVQGHCGSCRSPAADCPVLRCGCGTASACMTKQRAFRGSQSSAHGVILIKHSSGLARVMEAPLHIIPDAGGGGVISLQH